jgi:xanthine dehydrogenase molybdopterin-binding subunit B
MPLDLPKPIAEYFAADHASDAHALARCFADGGVVHDEGGTFRGTGATIVAAQVTGDFPGSPVTLDHVFRLAGDKIVSLEIR